MSQPTADSLKALDANIAKLRAQGKDVSALEQKRADDAAALKAPGVKADKDNVGVVDPTNKSEAAAAKLGRDTANDPIGALKDMASSGATAVSDAVSGIFGGGDDSGDDAAGGDDAKGTKGKFRWGKTIAGVIGVALAYLASSIFGGGWLGTIMFALFAIPAFMMGRNQLGDTFSRWFGEPVSKDSPAKGNEVQLAQAQEQNGQTLVAEGQVQAAPKLTAAQKIQQQASELSEKTEIMGFVMQQQAAMGRLEPRRGATMLRNLNEARQVVSDLGRVNLGALTEEQAQLLNRTMRNTDNSLDRMLANDPIMSVQVMQQVEALRAQRAQQQAQQSGVVMGPMTSTLPPAGGPSYPTGVVVGPSTYTRPQGPVFMGNGNPQTIVGVVPPEAQLQLMAIRQSGQNYQYQAAQPGSHNPQRFNSLPADEPFVVATHYGAR